ncbi:MAG TPA: alpha/beta hydrolase [Chloroflexota bacterium]|nr:alpha/beta hydrolase [Chloroflexota bacterium]
MTQRRVSLVGGKFVVDLLEQGDGAPLLYLHGIWDGPDNPLVAELAHQHRVLAPWLPGFGTSTGEEHLLDIHDAIYYYLDLLDAVHFQSGDLVGHGLGGMFAAELAAVQPERFTSLTLIAPFGLWDPEHPIPDFFAMAPAEVAQAAQGQDSGAPLAVGGVAAPPETGNDEERVAFSVERARALAGAARFLWPLPNRGLAKRIHRVCAPTLLVWGANDGIIPPSYGSEFQQRIASSRLEVLPSVGHLAHCEQPARVAALINNSGD